MIDFNETEIKQPEVLGDIHNAALKLLEDPALLYHVHNATDDVVGEDENRVVLWLLAGISNPLQSVEIGGDSGSGKNRLADSVTKCFPPSWTEKYTTVSAKSIRYVENPIRTLYLAERPHKHDDEEESHTDLDIKLLISEPGGLTPLVTIFDAKTGRPKSVPIKTTIQNVIMTTTDVSCAVELENRVWSLITDNSPEQNRRVLDRQGWLASGLPSQRPDYDAPKPIIQEVAFMIDKEAPKRVTIPYAQIFIDWVLRLQSETRARRDYLKILDLIKAIARAHYKQNPKIYDPNTKEDVIIATVEDFLQANRIGEKILTQTVTGINDRHMELYREACKLMDNHEILTIKTLTERMKRVKKRISAATVRRGIDVIVDAGLLRSTGTTQTGGKPADVYERNLDLNDLKEKKKVQAPIELITEITESYRKWCITQGVEPKHRIPINPIDGKPIIIEKQENKPEGLSRFANPRKLVFGILGKRWPDPQNLRAPSVNIRWEIRYQDYDAATSKMFLSIREPYSYRLMVKTRPRLSQQGRWYFDAELLETTDPKPERIIEGQHSPAMLGLVYTISVGNTDFITEFNQLLKSPENTGSRPGSLLVNAIIDIHAGTLMEWGKDNKPHYYKVLRLQRLRERLRQLLSE